LYRRIKPNLVHLLAVKPSVLGSAAAILSNQRPVVNNLAGLGFAFSQGVSRTVRRYRAALLIAFRLSFNRSRMVTIVENPDDREVLVQEAHIKQERVRLIHSIGVDLSRFPLTPEPTETMTVRMAARLLKPKGVVEFAEAAEMLRDRGVPVRMQLIGTPDPGNPLSLSVDELEGWAAAGIVDWLGWRDDMPAVWQEANIGVLPSFYGEGVPVSLLEAGATGRALIATDVAGCRDVVINEVTGLLIPPRDPVSLANAIARLAADGAKRKEMGEAVRRHVEKNFSQAEVRRNTMALYDELCPPADDGTR
jgi:glycosyltransferase involved in cell wall biosynthesis